VNTRQLRPGDLTVNGWFFVGSSGRTVYEKSQLGVVSVSCAVTKDRLVIMTSHKLFCVFSLRNKRR
jgi:hypothetical protein